MSLSGFLPAVSRRAVALGTVAALAGIVSVVALKAQATSAPPQTPAPAATEDPLTFKTPEPRLVLLSLTPDAGAAMEAAVAKAKEALSGASAKPEQKQQAAHWKVYKSVEVNGDVSMFFMLDQTVPNVTYNPFKPVYDAITASGADRKDVDALLARINAAGAIKGLKAFPITMIADMAGSGGH